ncbi:MAG: hypothetical protein M5U28_56535 [Sandaracinaceae bacterium]|nr:hypothetical protein [Sandaracinaceae bacterium]
MWLISLIFYRYMFFRFEPSDLMPPYWINMGAVAISTLAGALLVDAAASSAAMAPLVPFIKGVTLAFWATATWWIPMLLLLGAWRYAVRRVRFAYDPLYWGWSSCSGCTPSAPTGSPARSTPVPRAAREGVRRGGPGRLARHRARPGGAPAPRRAPRAARAAAGAPQQSVPDRTTR